MCDLLDEDALVFGILLAILKKCRNMQKIRDENQKQVKKIEGEGGVDSTRVKICREEMKSLVVMEERRKKMKEYEMVQF